MADEPLITLASADAKTEEVSLKSGRRWYDWHVLTSDGQSIFFWLFGMFLDEKRKPSMSRIMLAIWTWLGVQMIVHELHGHPAVSNAAWSGWWTAEGALTLAVFGPRVASYFGAGAAGANASTAIATSLRDGLEKIQHKEDGA